MPTPQNLLLYKKAKNIADNKYKKSSAFKSGFIVKTYKKMGGTYEQDNKEPKLKRWFNEKWIDIGKKEYPVFRPTIRINKETPKTVSELDSRFIKKQIELKQKIKGKKNLPPFI